MSSYSPSYPSPPSADASSSSSSPLYDYHHYQQPHQQQHQQPHNSHVLYNYPSTNYSKLDLQYSELSGTTTASFTQIPPPSRLPHVQSYPNPLPGGVDDRSPPTVFAVPAPRDGNVDWMRQRRPSQASPTTSLPPMKHTASTTALSQLGSKDVPVVDPLEYVSPSSTHLDDVQWEAPYLFGPMMATPSLSRASSTVYSSPGSEGSGKLKGRRSGSGSVGDRNGIPYVGTLTSRGSSTEQPVQNRTPPMMPYPSQATFSPIEQLDPSSHTSTFGHTTPDIYNSLPAGTYDLASPPLPDSSRFYPHISTAPIMPTEQREGSFTIPPPSVPFEDRLVFNSHPSSTRHSVSSSSSSSNVSSPPHSNASPPAHSLSPEQRAVRNLVQAPAEVVTSSPVTVSPEVAVILPPAVGSSQATLVGSPEAKRASSAETHVEDGGDELNLIADGPDAPNSPAKEGKPSIFECPGCDLTFTRLSALKQHMLSHTGEKPHACTHCGRRFSLASNLRRHTSTKACKVLKFQEVKENISGAPIPPLTTPATPAPPVVSVPTPVTPPPSMATSPTILGPIAAVTSSPLGSPTAVKKDKKRKAPAEKPAPRRKRHANQEARWIPRTLALFKNAHMLTSTPPFQFCIYKATRKLEGTTPGEYVDDDDEEPEPFTRPTLPLHPVRPNVTSRASIRSFGSTSTSSSSGYDDTFSDGEERNSYEEAPEFPYHPAAWAGRLPGPGLLGGDELVKNPSVARRWMSFKR